MVELLQLNKEPRPGGGMTRPPRLHWATFNPT
jgi:hypothetical protein